MSDDTAPDGLPWGLPGQVPDTEWVWVKLCWGTMPVVGRRTATIGHPDFYRFAPVLDVAALQEQLAAAERRAEEAEAACAAMRTAAEPAALALEILAQERRLVNCDVAGLASALRAALASDAGRLILADLADWREVLDAIKQHLLGSDEDHWVDVIEEAGRDQSALLVAIDARIEAERRAEEAEAQLPHESWTMAARRRLAQALEKKP